LLLMDLGLGRYLRKVWRELRGLGDSDSRQHISTAPFIPKSELAPKRRQTTSIQAVAKRIEKIGNREVTVPEDVEALVQKIRNHMKNPQPAPEAEFQDEASAMSSAAAAESEPVPSTTSTPQPTPRPLHQRKSLGMNPLHPSNNPPRLPNVRHLLHVRRRAKTPPAKSISCRQSICSTSNPSVKTPSTN
jgi:hypothetical protein